MAQVRLVGNSGYVLSDLVEGDAIDLKPGYADIKLVADFSPFEAFYAAADQRFSKYNEGHFNYFRDGFQVPIAPETYARLVAFQRQFETDYASTITKNTDERHRQQLAKRQVRLSDTFKENAVACSELSMLAYRYMQSHGMKPEFVAGSYVRDYEGEYSETGPHAYLIATDPATGKKFIFDPANFLNVATMGYMPSVFPLSDDEYKMLTAGEKLSKFVERKELLTGKTRYYGFAPNSVYFEPERDL